MDPLSTTFLSDVIGMGSYIQVFIDSMSKLVDYLVDLAIVLVTSFPY